MGDFEFKSFKNVYQRLLNINSITIAQRNKNCLEKLKSALNDKIKQKYILKQSKIVKIC